MSEHKTLSSGLEPFNWAWGFNRYGSFEMVCRISYMISTGSPRGSMLMGARVSHHHLLVPRVGVSGHKNTDLRKSQYCRLPRRNYPESPRYHYVIMELGPRRPSVFFWFRGPKS